MQVIAGNVTGPRFARSSVERWARAGPTPTGRRRPESSAQKGQPYGVSLNGLTSEPGRPVCGSETARQIDHVDRGVVH